MSEDRRLVYLMTPVGPVAEAFIYDERVITGIMGPYGSGKTTTCISKIWQSIGLQPLVNGKRKARWAVVRDTYQQLETNVLNSWFAWFPKTKDNWNGRENCHRLRFQMLTLEGGPAEVWELEMYFRAMGDQKAEAVLKGLELTGLWMNETDTLDKSVLRFGLPRTGRYPSAKDGGCGWSGVICDFNAPDMDNWTYGLFVDQDMGLDEETDKQMRKTLGRRYGVGFHRQPGGRSVDPPPENIRNLEEGYYEKQMIGATPADIRRFVDNEFGAVRNGQPVYPEYNDAFHCSHEPLKAVPGVPVCLGLDGGNTPAIVAGQMLPSGQVRTLDELVVFKPDERDTLETFGPRQFGREAGMWWAERFGKQVLGAIWADPSAWNGETEDFSWIKEFEAGFAEGARLRVKVKPAPVKGNRLPPRLEAVRRGLVQNAAGGQPGELISSTCKRLRAGFISGYVITRVQLSNGSGRWKDDPEKNDYSHVHDAKQYLNLGLRNRGHMLSAEEQGARASAQRRPKINHGSGFFTQRAS